MTKIRNLKPHTEGNTSTESSDGIYDLLISKHQAKLVSLKSEIKDAMKEAPHDKKQEAKIIQMKKEMNEVAKKEKFLRSKKRA